MPSLVEMQYDQEQNIMCLEKIAMKFVNILLSSDLGENSVVLSWEKNPRIFCAGAMLMCFGNVPI